MSNLFPLQTQGCETASSIKNLCGSCKATNCGHRVDDPKREGAYTLWKQTFQFHVNDGEVVLMPH